MSPSVSSPGSQTKPAAATATLLGPSTTAAPGPALFFGLDVHNDSIAVSIAPSDSTEVRRYGVLVGTLRLREELREVMRVLLRRLCCRQS